MPSLIVDAVETASPVIARVRATLEKFGASFGSFGKLATTAAVPLLGVATAIAAVGAAVLNAKNVVNWVDDLSESAGALGITEQSLASYQQMAQEAGVQSDALGMAFNKLSKAATGAASGNKDQIAFFKALGVSVKDANGNMRGFDEILLDVSRAFVGMKGGPAKIALEMEAFGRSGAKMDDALNKISSGVQRNTGLTDDFIGKAKLLQDQLDQMSAAWKRLSVVLAGPVVDALVAVGKAFGLIQKSPIEELGDQIAKVQRKIAERESKGSWLKYWNTDTKELKAELKLLEGQAFSVFRAMEAASFDKRDAPVVPDSTGGNAAEAARKAAAAARAKLLEQDEKDRKELRRLLDEEYEDNLRFDEKNLAREKEYRENVSKLIAKYDEEQRKALEEGQEVIAKRSADRIKGIEDRIDQLTDVTDSFFTQLSSFEGQDVFKTLGKDLYQVVYRMLILEPVLERIRTTLKSMAVEASNEGGGSGWLGIIMKLFGAAVGGAGGGANYGQAGGGVGGFDMALGGPTGFAQRVGEAGPELFIPKSQGTIIPNHLMGGVGGVTVVNNVQIDSRTDRGTIAAMLEANRSATLRDVREQLARRGTMLRV